MATNCSTSICSPSLDDRRLENDAFLEAIQKCDDETYQQIISILTEAGLLPG